MIVKRNIIKAKAEAHLGGDVKDTYENAIPIYEYGDKVRISNDGKSIYINFQGQPIRFDHEKGYRQLEAIEKAKQQQPK
jgi:hypothetical protein